INVGLRYIPICCVARGHKDVFPCRWSIPDSTAPGVGGNVIESGVDSPVIEMHGHHFAVLNGIVAMIADSDINAVVKNERSGIANLLVQICEPASRDLRDGGRLPKQGTVFGVKRDQMPITQVRS